LDTFTAWLALELVFGIFFGRIARRFGDDAPEPAEEMIEVTITCPDPIPLPRWDERHWEGMMIEQQPIGTTACSIGKQG
jgi:hypothetical protein